MSGQTWRFKQVNSDFEGNYSVVYAEGSGGSFPYESPSFMINNIKGGLNVYISGLGYTGNGYNHLIFVFDGSRRYESTSDLVSASSDSESLFVSGARREGKSEELSIYHLLYEVETSSRMSVRFSNSYKTNTFSYRLDGSSAALSKMFGKNYLSTIQETYNIQKFKRTEKKRIIDSVSEFKTDSTLLRFDSIYGMEMARTKTVRLIADSIIEEFFNNSNIQGQRLGSNLSSFELEGLKNLLSEKYRAMPTTEKFIKFQTKETDSGTYKLIMVYESSDGEIMERYLLRRFDYSGRLKW